MTAALALSAYFTDSPAGVRDSAPLAQPEESPSLVSFDGLLAEVSREILADNPELDASITEDAQGIMAPDVMLADPGIAEAVDRDVLLESEGAMVFDESGSSASLSEFSPDTAALIELDDARYVFMASTQWTPPRRVQPEAELAIQPEMTPLGIDPSLTGLNAATQVVPILPPSANGSDPMDVSMVVQGLASDSELIDVRVVGYPAPEPVVVPSNIQAEQALYVIHDEGFPVDDLLADESESEVCSDSPQELDSPATLKRVDPIQLRTLDSLPLAEPVLVSVDNMESKDTNVPVGASVPADTPELPVAPLDLDVVRVDIDHDLAVEVRTLDGEVDVALLGADAVKPVMKGVQAELRESLKRGGYDLGQFERSEQDQAERRHRRRQHQHQERRDPRRGALL